MKVAQIVRFAVTLSGFAHCGALSCRNRGPGYWFKKRPDEISAVHDSIGLRNGIESHDITSLALAFLNMGRSRIVPKIISYLGIISDLNCSKFRALLGIVL